MLLKTTTLIFIAWEKDEILINFLRIIINMFNNFTCENEYECCNVVIEATENTGALLIGDFNSATD